MLEDLIKFLKAPEDNAGPFLLESPEPAASLDILVQAIQALEEDSLTE